MSKKRKNNIEELPNSSSDLPKEVIKISFSHWFNKKLKDGKVKFYQDEALLVFMKKRGLSQNEDEDSYNRAFENF